MKKILILNLISKLKQVDTKLNTKTIIYIYNNIL